jgi:septal ring factor EnvC (AmiA/AmiB activator)
MLEIALAGINSFAFAPKADIITALFNGLQGIKNEVAELRDKQNQDRQEIQDLEATVARQDGEISTLRQQLCALNRHPNKRATLT